RSCTAGAVIGGALMPKRHIVGSAILCTALSATAIARGADKSRPIAGDDLRWLNRVTFGVNAETFARYRELGRVKFLDEQLRAPAEDARAIAADVAALSISQHSALQLARDARDEQQRINRVLPEDERQRARMAQNQAAQQANYEATKRHL